MKFKFLNIYKSVIILATFLVPGLLFAQPGGGGPGDPSVVPIGGLEILIAAGAALGIRSIVKSKKS